MRALTAAVLLLTATGCDLYREARGDRTVQLDGAVIESLRIGVRAPGGTICPRKPVQLAVAATVVEDGKRTALETWSGSGETANKNGKLGFDDFLLASREGKLARDGWFVPNPNVLATVATGFTIRGAYRETRSAVESRFKPDYACITSAGGSGRPGPAGPPGTEGARGGEGVVQFGGLGFRAAGLGRLSPGHTTAASASRTAASLGAARNERPSSRVARSLVSGGDDGGDGGPGGRGASGGKGPSITVYATLVKTPFHDRLVALSIQGDVQDFVLVPVGQTVTLTARGGPGGAGGPGGKGGDGGGGVSGQPGGDGGDGGPGGDGGDGGPGGTLELVIDSRFPELAERIRLDASGGDPGSAGAGGAGGRGGRGGTTTTSPEAASSGRVNVGPEGNAGERGASGRPGRPGPAGRAATRTGVVGLVPVPGLTPL